MNNVVPALGLAAPLGRGMQRVATDAVVGRLRSLPRSINELDPQALSKIIGRQVTSVSFNGGDASAACRTKALRWKVFDAGWPR